jgi:hypothetical protein
VYGYLVKLESGAKTLTEKIDFSVAPVALTKDVPQLANGVKLDAAMP